MKNTFVKVLSVVMALMMLVGTFSMIPVAAATCAHTNAHVEAVVEPTCVKAGFTRFHCDDCGEEFIDNITAATGEHTWVNKGATEATCDKLALSAHKECSVCGEIKDATVIAPELEHVYTVTVVHEATCTEDGYTVTACARCGAEDEDTVRDIVPASHEIVYTVETPANAATCTSGTIRVTCAKCNDVNYTINETNNHDWKDIKGATIDRNQAKYKNIPVVGESCKDTYKNGKYCTICGATKDMVANDKNTHSLSDANFDNGIIDADEVTAELLALSWNGVAFGAGTATKLDPTCTAKGYQLKYCSICEEYMVTEIAKLACAVTGDKNSKSTVGPWVNADGVERFNKDKKADDIKKSAYHYEDLTRTTTCDACGEVVKTETYTGTAHDYDWTKDKKQMGTVVTPKTCLVNGYTTYTCEYCAETHKTVEATDVAKGEHTWSANPTKYADTFDCKDKATWTNACTYTCTYENCDTAKGATKTADYNGKQEHDYEKKTVDATCIADAYYYNECKRCGTIGTGNEAPKDKPTAGFNATNHVVNTKDQTQALKLLKEGDAATCTNAKINKYLCACNEIIDVTVEAQKAHNKNGVFTDKNHNGKVDADEINAAAVTATCQTKEVKQGKYCTVCNTVTETSKVGNTNANNHAVEGVFVKTVAPTCSAKGYDQFYFDCCGGIKNVNETNKVEANHKYKEVKGTPASCYAAGTKDHFVCELCNKLFLAQDNVAKKESDLVIKQYTDGKNPGHKWGSEIKKVEETCDSDGTKAHKICQNPDCGAYLIDGKAVHDDPATKNVNEIAEALKIAAHGTEYQGWHTGKAPTCTEGGYYFKDATDYSTVYACSKCEKHTVGKTNHAGTRVTTSVNAKGTADYDCTKPTWTLVECTACGDTYFEDYQAAKNTAHNLDRNGDKKIDVKDAIAVGIPTCTEDAEDLYQCKDCGANGYTEYRPGKAATGHKINYNGVDIKVDFACNSADHKNYKGFACVNGCAQVLGTDVEHEKVSAEYKAPTCTETGHEAFDYCKNCNEVLDGNVVSIPATDHPNKEFVEEADGNYVYHCPDCGEYIYEEIVPEVVETITLSTDKVAAGDVITATFALSGAETTFSALNLTIDYDADLLTFVGVEAAGIDGLYAIASDNGYNVGVALIVANDAEGNGREITTTAEGTVLFTLTFVANKTASGDAYIGDEWFTIDTTGDLNGDSIVTAEDAQAIFNYIGTNDVAADANNDGVVTLADAIALAKFAASTKTAADFLEMVGELDKLEDEVFAIFDAGRINDVNNDGIANIADAYELIEQLEFALQVMDYSELANIVTMAELVSFVNKAA